MRWLRSSVVPVVFLAATTACASAPAAEPRTEVRVEPLPPASNATAPLPALPPTVAAPTIIDAKVPRLTTLTAINQDIAIVVRELALKFGLQYRIDPAVRGVVNVDLRNRTLPEALTAILPRGVSFEISDGVLVVAPTRIVTRIFSLDYVALSRFGTTATVIQRRLPPLGAANSLRGLGDSAATADSRKPLVGGASDVVGGVSVANVWEEIRVGVEALVFDQADPVNVRSPSGPGSTQRPGTPADPTVGPNSRSAPDGRRVIVNPMAGSITVSAFPDRLEQVDAFIRTFESSIQRQALIEATIVEVELDPGAQNGIDWSVVASRGAGALLRPRLTGPSTNVELTLGDGSARIAGVISALATQGRVRVLSRPRASALNNQRVVFDVTTGEIVFSRSRAFVTGANGNVMPVTQVSPTQVNVGLVLDILAIHPEAARGSRIRTSIKELLKEIGKVAAAVG